MPDRRAAASGPSGEDWRRTRRRARRARLRRRRLALVVVLAAVAAVLVLVLTGGSSPARRHRSAGAAAHSGAGGRTARTGRATASAPTRTLAASSSESPEIKRLIALGRPIYCAPPRGDEVALTFDDGPGPYTRLMLAKLRKHGLHATFFVVGRNIGLVPGATRAERAIGAVGDHTFSHPELTTLAPREAEAQIVRTQHDLERSSGGRVFLFRPPYGAHDATVDAIAKAHGLLEILWNVDSADSLGANYAQIERNVIAGLHPGSIILMHENHGQTIRAMIAIFTALQRKHLRAVSVPQLLTDDPPSAAQLRSDGGGCGISAAGLSSGG
jgi:peptidoglycan/xylan/chitin deacetylase (PgdA/CDA1 family)